MKSSKHLLWFLGAIIFAFTLACGSSDEPLPPAGDACGTRGSGPCQDAAQSCFFPTGQCGRLDKGGVCATPPDICTEDYRPVCGCDGNTYSNTCHAKGAGVSVDFTGKCPVQPQCTDAECGPQPPIAPPQQCADGTEEDISIECGRGESGVCGWQIERNGCPVTCKTEDCGPPPPIAPPQQCADGTEERVSMNCKPNTNDQCGWHIERSGCPDP